MVRRRSTVRFRKGAPGCEEYSNIHPVTASAPQGALGALLDGYPGHREFDQGVSGADASRGGQVSGSGSGANRRSSSGLQGNCESGHAE